MRDYGIVTPKFWIGDTGKKLRGDASSQLLALYLMTSPHASMIGVYHCPVLYMAHETGLGMEGASKALARLIEVGFCVFDEASETVFVINMAGFQIAESLDPKDKRVLGIQREVNKMEPGHIRAAFLATYSVAFHLKDDAPKVSPSQAPSKPLPSQEQDQDQEQDHSEANASGGKPPADEPPLTVPAVRPGADLRDQVFSTGVLLLMEARVDEKHARSFLAAQCKAHGEPRVLQALQMCAEQRPGQPVPWLVEILKTDAAKAPGKSGKHAGLSTIKYAEGVNADGSFA